MILTVSRAQPSPARQPASQSVPWPGQQSYYPNAGTQRETERERNTTINNVQWRLSDHLSSPQQDASRHNWKLIFTLSKCSYHGHFGQKNKTKQKLPSVHLTATHLTVACMRNYGIRFQNRYWHNCSSCFPTNDTRLTCQKNKETRQNIWLLLFLLMQPPNKGLSVLWLADNSFVRFLSGRASGPAHISDTSPAIHLFLSLSRLCMFHFDKCTRTGSSCRTVGGGEAGRGGMDRGKLDLIDKCLRIALLLTLSLLASCVCACRLHARSAETLLSGLFFSGYLSDGSSQ